MQMYMVLLQSTFLNNLIVPSHLHNFKTIVSYVWIIYAIVTWVWFLTLILHVRNYVIRKQYRKISLYRRGTSFVLSTKLISKTDSFNEIFRYHFTILMVKLSFSYSGNVSSLWTFPTFLQLTSWQQSSPDNKTTCVGITWCCIGHNVVQG